MEGAGTRRSPAAALEEVECGECSTSQPKHPHLLAALSPLPLHGPSQPSWPRSWVLLPPVKDSGVRKCRFGLQGEQ